MVLINRATTNFVVELGEKVGKSLLSKPVKATKITGLKYMPRQLSTDVVEVSQKAMPRVRANIEPSTLQELANKGLSLNQMAAELNVPISTIRVYLQKHNIITGAQKEFRVLKDYFTATKPEDKAKAFEEVDKYLAQIAKEEAKLNKGSLYEDCLQDVRLRFFELVNQSQKDGLAFPKTILQKVRESRPALKPEISTMKPNSSTIAKIDKPVNDYKTEDFELMDSYKQLLKSSKDLTERDKYFLSAFVEKGKTLEEIASSCGLTRERVRQILKHDIASKLQAQRDKTMSSEYLHKRAESATKYINKLEASEEARKCNFFDGNYALRRW